MKILRQSTAATIAMGPFVDYLDGVTPEAGLSPTVRRSFNGGAWANRSGGSITHMENGYYSVPLDTTDTGTLGRLKLAVTAATTHAPVWDEYLVVPAAVYDALVAGTGNGVRADVQTISSVVPVAANVTQISGDAAAADNLEATYDGTGYANASAPATQGAVSGLNDLAIADVQTALTNQGLTTTRAGNLDELAAANLPTDVAANLAAIAALNDLDAQAVRDAMKLAPTAGAPAAGSIDEHADDILADTAAMQPTVATNLDAAITSRAVAGDAMTLTAGERGAMADAVWDEALSGHAAAGSTGEALSNAAAGGAGLTQQQVRDAMKLAPTAGAPAAGSVDEHLDDILADTAAIDTVTATNLDATVSSRATAASVAALNDIDAQGVRDAMKLAPTAGAPAAGSLDEHADDILADTAAMQPNIDAAVSSRAAPGAAMALTSGERGAVSDAIWDEILSGHAIAGSTGEALSNAAAGGAGLTQQQVRDAMKLAPTAGAPAAGSIDEDTDTILTRLSATRAANLDEVTAARLAELDGANLPADVAAVDATATAVGAAVLALNDLSQAEAQTAAAAAIAAAEPVDANVTQVAGGAVAGVADFRATGFAVAGDAMTLTGATLTAIADAVWDELLAGHATAGSAGQAMQILTAVAAKRNVRFDQFAYTNVVDVNGDTVPRLDSCRMRVFPTPGDTTAQTNVLETVTVTITPPSPTEAVPDEIVGVGT